MFKSILRIGMPTPKLLGYQRYCFIAPHPDDIELGAGGTVARLKAMGKHVTYIIATDGRYGGSSADISPQELVEIRKQETLAAANHLGVDKVVMLGFCEAGRYEQAELVKKIALAAAEAQPDIIFTVDHLVPTELHADHINIGAACSEIVFFLDNYHYMNEIGGQPSSRPLAGIAYFFTNRPNRYIKVSKYYKKQVEALLMHTSQMHPYGEKTLGDMFKILIFLRNLRYGVRRFTLQAEAFRVLSVHQAHCMPEFGERNVFRNN